MVQTVIVIVGPTAVGKTTAGISIAEALNGEVISADSRQIYRGMEIGTGAPSPEEMARVKHHLVSVIEPDQLLSAGQFAQMARVVINDMVERGKMPIIVGGSGLYIRALIDGLASIPLPDGELRQQVEREIDERGMEAMLSELQQIDPEYAAKITLSNRKRLTRALEVYRMTGKTFSSYHQPTEPWCNPVIFGLSRPRAELIKIIEKRVRSMIASGWIEELQLLIDKYGDDLPRSVTEALGYRDLLPFIQSEKVDIEATIERIVIATRQFAKRQMTWFRADKRIIWREL